MTHSKGNLSLFASTPPVAPREELAEGAWLLRGFALAGEAALLSGMREVTAAAPFRNMITPGGYRMSVAMTNCGEAGWVTDRKGYRYSPVDPMTGRPWPPIPASVRRPAEDAADAAGYPSFEPDACLINLYEPETRLSLHRDENERDMTAPIVSVSLGLPAIFLFGGNSRSDRPRRVGLESGAGVWWG